MLGLPEPAQGAAAPPVQRWAVEQGVALPAAVREWAALDGGDLMSRSRNQDWFYFDPPSVVSPSQGAGLLFCIENQSNFGKVVLLEHGEDPPVLFGWLMEEPWVMHTQRFS